MNPRRVTKNIHLSEGLQDIGHSMSIGNLILGVDSVTVSYLNRHDNLLQNAIDIITKCKSYFITKCDKSLLQNASGCLLQSAIVLLQIAAVVTNCNNFITKCDSYFKMRRLLQIVTVHWISLINQITARIVRSRMLLFVCVINDITCGVGTTGGALWYKERWNKRKVVLDGD